MPDLKISEFEERTSLQGSEDVGAADAGLNVRFKVATLRLYLNEVWGEYAGFINIAAFSKTNVEKGIIFSGINGDGQKVRVIIPRISLAMSGDFGWISDEASPLTVGGQALYVPELQSDADFGPFMRIDTMPDLPV